MSTRLLNHIWNSELDFWVMEVWSSLDPRIKNPSDTDYVLFWHSDESHQWDPILETLSQNGFRVDSIIDGSYRIIDEEEKGSEIGIVMRCLEKTKKYVSDLANSKGTEQLRYKTWAVWLEFPEGFAGDVLSGKIHRDTSWYEVELLKKNIAVNMENILWNLREQTVTEILNKLNQLRSQLQRHNIYAIRVIEWTLLNLLMRLWYIQNWRLGRGIKHFNIDCDDSQENDPIILSIKSILKSNFDLDKLITLYKHYE